MLVHQQYRKCIAFLCLPHAEKNWTPVGTAFFVGVEVAPQLGALYIVTARHVVEGARSDGRPLSLRLNRRDGTAAFIEVDPDAWLVAHDTDVAARLVPASLAADYDIGWLRPSQMATTDVLSERKVGPGDEVFFSGLFTAFPGVERVEPLIRFGTISMMPRERVPIENADGSRSMVEAFLVEARSWGGQSGSPAFVYFPATRQPGFLELGTLTESARGDPLIPDREMPQLLGLVQGHFNLKEDVAFAGDVYGTAHVPLNAGVAIVIPTQKVIATLTSEEAVAERKDRLEEPDPGTVADVARPEEQEDAQWTRDDFLHDLKHPSRPAEKPPQARE